MKQRDLLTRRWRKVKAPDPKETPLQIQVVSFAKKFMRPGVLMMAIPNGEVRNAHRAVAMGVRAGAADLMFMWRREAGHTEVLFLEMKRITGKTSDDQDDFAESARAVGADYAVAHSFAEAVEVLKRRDLLKVNVTV